MKAHRWVKAFWMFAAALLLLAACGGGGGGSTPTASSNWDAMVWDQGTWK
jgi:ABC-type glycerol-3-phosphate transport system substrate-binding protein